MAEFFSHIVTDGQTLFDIAIQQYGSLEGIVPLREDNPELIPSIDTRLNPGDDLKIRTEFTELDDTAQENQRLFRTKEIPVNTGDVEAIGDFNPDFNDDFFN